MARGKALKVLVASSTYHPYNSGGGSYSAKRLAEGLSQGGELSVEVLSLGDRDSREVIDDVVVHRIRPRNVYWSYRANDQPAIRKVMWHLIETSNFRMRGIARWIHDELRPDIVHFRNIEDFSPIMFYYLRGLGIKTLQTLNSYTMLEPRGTLYRSSLGDRLSMRAYRNAFIAKRFYSRYVSAVAAVSEATLHEHTARGYYRAVPSYVVRTRLPLQPRQIAKVGDSDRLRIGFFGSFVETKGIRELIQAFRMAGMPNQELVLGGDDRNEYGAVCRLAAAGDSRIQFLGHQSPSNFFPSIHVLVIPSVWKEPYPRVLAEAMSYGCPVIASDRGGTKEGILPGTTGFIYRSQSELVSLLGRLEANRRSLVEMREAIIAEQSVVDSDESAEYRRIYRRLTASYPGTCHSN